MDLWIQFASLGPRGRGAGSGGGRDAQSVISVIRVNVCVISSRWLHFEDFEEVLDACPGERLMQTHLGHVVGNQHGDPSGHIEAPLL
jgi:hypothetical protein